ncbi:MAG: EamA family transporter [Spirochaetia bacterium]|nr:EamA family transporter [Spirochaetia bacterium]
MSTMVFFLVLLAAVAHASWNFLSKKISGNLPIFWLGSMCINLVLLPFTIVIICRNGFNWNGAVPILISALFHCCYYITLFNSYKFGEISAAYPISRGTGVALTALVAVFALHDYVSGIGWCGIILIVAGILTVGLSNTMTKEDITSCLFAFLTGITIAGYSLADSRSAGLNHPVVSLNVMSITSLVLVSPIAFRKGFSKTVRENLDHLPYAPVIGLGSLGTYLIIMYAFSLSNHASYIVALRECSVIIASILGFTILKEKPTPQKIIGIILITVGLVLIKLG